MAENTLNAAAWRENIRALALAAGLSEETAAARLDCRILITHDDSDPASVQLVNELVPVLSRTVVVALNSAAGTSSSFAAELIIGTALARTGAPHVFASQRLDRCIISRTPCGGANGARPHPLMAVVAACYVAGAVIYRAVGEGLPNPPPDEFEVLFEDLTGSVDLSNVIELGDTYLAGAGAIGNGFLWAARYIRLTGRLHVADDDMVSAGNLQRQIWFEAEDIGKPKVTVLCERAQAFFPDCTLIPSECRLQQHPDRNDGPWLRRLIVAVDSRGARRHLQDELPGEVFDASTTGSQEIVLHYNRQPTDLACLGCIYPHDAQEVTHEQAIAEHLGIDLQAVQRERIDANIARQICVAHPHLDPAAIEGLAFDTLYKQLCSSGQLKSVSGKQVVAPFAFVSVLAGALLVLELARHQPGSGAVFSNDWRVNPWRPPVPAMRQCRPRRDNCLCCGRSEIRQLNDMFWGVADASFAAAPMTRTVRPRRLRWPASLQRQKPTKSGRGPPKL